MSKEVTLAINLCDPIQYAYVQLSLAGSVADEPGAAHIACIEFNGGRSSVRFELYDELTDDCIATPPCFLFTSEGESYNLRFTGPCGAEDKIPYTVDAGYAPGWANVEDEITAKVRCTPPTCCGDDCIPDLWLPGTPFIRSAGATYGCMVTSTPVGPGQYDCDDSCEPPTLPTLPLHTLVVPKLEVDATVSGSYSGLSNITVNWTCVFKDDTITVQFTRTGGAGSSSPTCIEDAEFESILEDVYVCGAYDDEPVMLQVHISKNSSLTPFTTNPGIICTQCPGACEQCDSTVVGGTTQSCTVGITIGTYCVRPNED